MEPDNKTLELSARGEAEPVPESQYCSACRGYFSCYLAHIGSIQHRSNSLAQNGPFLSGIDDVIRDLEVKIQIKRPASPCGAPERAETPMEEVLDYYSQRVKEMQQFLQTNRD